MRKLRFVFVAAVILVGGGLITLMIPGVTKEVMSRVYRARYDGHPPEYWVRELKNPDPHVRQKAVFALGSIGADAEDAVPAVCAVLKEDSSDRVRCDAALALLKMYPASRMTATTLAAALEDRILLTRLNAAIALNRLGPDARPAVPALLKALEDKQNNTYIPGFNLSIRETLLQGLGRASAGSADAVEALSQALQADSLPPLILKPCRAAAARALGDVGPEARSAVPLLQAALKDDNGKVRKAAEDALKKIQPEQQ
jgi:HEAT repeat protein